MARGIGAVTTTVESTTVRCASLGRRVLSHLVDWALIGTVQSALVVGALAPGFPRLVADLTEPRTADPAGAITASIDALMALVRDRGGWLLAAVAVAWALGGVYEVVLTRRGGTIGKRAAGLTVVDAGSLAPLSWRACVLRWGGPAVLSGASLATVLAQSVTVFGYAWLVVDDRRRAVHDIIAGALVVESSSLPAPAPPSPPRR